MDLSPSEASSISRGSKGEGPRDEDKKMKMVQISSSDDDSLQKSRKMELDFFKSERNIIGSSSSSKTNIIKNEKDYEYEKVDDDHKKNSSTERTFCCKFCKREFSSSQALGGHQNTHKQEREIAQRRCQSGIVSNHHFGSLGNHYYSQHYPTYYGGKYPTYHPNPLVNNPLINYNRPLGVRMDSMIHKPVPSYNSNFRFWYDHQILESFGIMASSGTLKIEEIGYLGNHYYSQHYPIYYGGNYPTYHPNPLVNSPLISYNRPLGVRMDSMIHKLVPSYNPNFRFWYDHQVLDTFGIRASSGTLKIEETSDTRPPTTHQYQFMHNPSSSTAAVDGGQHIKFILEAAPKKDGDNNLDASGLDLSLKL